MANDNIKSSYNTLDDKIDLIWSGQSSGKDRRFSNYYDYYFSGEDIKVYIDGLFAPEDELDIASFAYSVRQEKQPLYGFWSYNFDTVLLGTRIITGEITLFTRYPKRMTDLLEQAAKARVMSSSERPDANAVVSNLYQNSGNVPKYYDDEKNIEKYWSYSQLDRITSDPFNKTSSGKNIFSAHPPFNFVILYGVEETALTPFKSLKSGDYSVSDNLDRMILSDINERSIKIDNISSPMKIVLQEIHLMNMSTAYTPGGQPVAEAYQFVARDYYFTEADLSFIKRLKTNNASEFDRPTNSQTSQTTTGFNLGIEQGLINSQPSPEFNLGIEEGLI